MTDDASESALAEADEGGKPSRECGLQGRLLRAETGLTRTIVLDDADASLTTEYDAAQIAATEGIDPTWDAGVVLKPAPPVTVDPAGPASGTLARTGADPGPGIIAAALGLLVGGGFLLVAALRRRRRAGTDEAVGRAAPVDPH